MVRVLIDTNVFVSFLLSKSRESGLIGAMLERAFQGEYKMVLPEELLEELERVVAEKPHLRQAIPALQLAEFLFLIRQHAEMLPSFTEPIPAVVRDPGEDYLLATAVVNEVDILVTGDNDLLVLREHLLSPRLLSPAEFIAVLSRSD